MSHISKQQESGAGGSARNPKGKTPNVRQAVRPAGQPGVKVEEFAPKVRPPAAPEDFDDKSYEPSTEEPKPKNNRQSGKIGWALLWLLGVPLPVLLVIYLIRGH